jgi:hypothetical protein
MAKWIAANVENLTLAYLDRDASVPRENRLDYRCAAGDQRACYLHQRQLEYAGMIHGTPL